MADHSFDDTFFLRVAGGDKKAFEKVYNTYFISLFYYARRFVRDEKAAEDITLESFLKLWTHFREFTSISGIKAFLHTATRNACLNHLRSNLRRSASQRELAYLLVQDHEEALAEQQITVNVYQAIFEEMENLPPQVRKVFYLSYIKGLSNQTIADLLQIQNQSVRNHKANALKLLRLALLQKDIFKAISLFFYLFLNFRVFH